jgi:hypothetical protein
MCAYFVYLKSKMGPSQQDIVLTEGHMGKWKVIFLRYYKETESKQCINNQWIVVSIFCLVRNPS